MSAQDTTDGILLAAYQARSGSIAAARSLAGSLLGRHGGAAPGSLGAGAQIVLELTRFSDPQKVKVKPFTYGPGRPSQDGTQIVGDQSVAKIVFDVVATAGTDGFAQSIRYRAAARQSNHQTPAGFYVDQFGFAPGSLTIDAIVLAIPDLGQRITRFKALLNEAKAYDPLSPSASAILRYTDTIEGVTLVLTQASLDVSKVADSPNQAVVTISADVLEDVALPAIGKVKARVSKTSSSSLSNALLSLGTQVIGDAIGGTLDL